MAQCNAIQYNTIQVQGRHQNLAAAGAVPVQTQQKLHQLVRLQDQGNIKNIRFLFCFVFCFVSFFSNGGCRGKVVHHTESYNNREYFFFS